MMAHQPTQRLGAGLWIRVRVVNESALQSALPQQIQRRKRAFGRAYAAQRRRHYAQKLPKGAASFLPPGAHERIKAAKPAREGDQAFRQVAWHVVTTLNRGTKNRGKPSIS